MTQKTSRRVVWQPVAAALPLFCPMLLGAGPALAQVSWSGGTSTNWFTGSNWSGGAVPGTGTSVTVDGGTPNAAAISGSATVGSLNGTGTITLDAFSTLEVDGTGGNSTFSGILTGGGEFLVEGNSRVTLTGRGTDIDELTLCSCAAGVIDIRGGSVYAGEEVSVLGGTLRISQGGDLETEVLVVDSAMVIDGAGSTVFVEEATAIGFIDNATLTISNGGLLESQSYAEIDALFGTPEVLVTGAGSEWDVEGLLLVGDASFNGTGALTVADGGIVQVHDRLVVGSGSTLHLGNGGAPGEILTPEIENNGEIHADFSGRWTLDIEITGDGGLTKDGDGTLVLGGSNRYGDTTRVRRGTLLVNGSITGPVLVQRDGTLGGGGILFAPVVAAGTIAPGNSIGTLTIDSDLGFVDGSVLEVEVDPASGSSDLLQVSGIAVLEGGTVRHVGSSGNYRSSSTYRILTADGGLIGTFGDVESDFAFLDPELDYDSNNVYLVLERNDVDADDIADTGNQSSTGTSIQSLGPGKPVYNAVIGLSEEEALEAYEALSGELHANVSGTLIEESRVLRDIPLARLRQAGTGAQAPVQQALAGASDVAAAPAPAARDITSWAQAFGAWGKRDSDGNAAAVDHAMGGLLLGADTAISDWRLGLFTGYDRRSTSVEERRSSSTVDTVHVGVYAGTDLGAIGLALGAAYSRHFIGSERDIQFLGFSESVEAEYGASTAQVFAEASYEVPLGRAAVEPFVGLAAVRSDSEGFSESGGAAALDVAENDHTVGYSTLGLRAATALSFGGLPPLTVAGSLGWRHAYGELAPDGSATLNGSDPFTIEGLPVASDAALIEAGVAMRLGSVSVADLSYAGQVGDGYQDHGLHLTMSLRF